MAPSRGETSSAHQLSDWQPRHSLSDTDVETESISHDFDGKGNGLPLEPASFLPDDVPRPSLRPGISSLARRPSIVDEDDEPISAVTAAQKARDSSPVTWMSLPKKGQLAVLTLARLSEPLAERSLSAYMFYQLRSFDTSLPDSTIASQGGMLTAAFAAAQFLTAVWWGRAADSKRIGRKRVLLVGLFGTCVSSIGVGFSKSFYAALAFRFMAGALNGNVGVMRTMISEIIREKKFQSRAFLLLPMCFNVGVIIGPILGGFLAEPITSFPTTFGPGSPLGGEKGVGWMREWPYALPNLVSGIFILISALGVVFGLDETHQARLHKPDYGRKIGRYLAGLLSKRRSGYQYTHLEEHEEDRINPAIDLEDQPRPSTQAPDSGIPAEPATHETLHKETEASQPASLTDGPDNSTKTPLQRPKVFTTNVLLTLVTHFLLALHISSFNALIFILLPTPRAAPSSPIHLPFRFTGGFGLSTSRVGLATAIIGVMGFPLLLTYPRLNARLGTVNAYRYCLPFSVAAYTALPYLVLLPSTATTTAQLLLWSCLTVVLALQVISRTFTLPSTVILVNNSVTDPSVLGTVHGVAQSVSSGARMLGPVLGGWVLGWGLKSQVNCVGAVWWGMAIVAVCNWGLLWAIKEGMGVGR